MSLPVQFLLYSVTLLSVFQSRLYVLFVYLFYSALLTAFVLLWLVCLFFVYSFIFAICPLASQFLLAPPPCCSFIFWFLCSMFIGFPGLNPCLCSRYSDFRISPLLDFLYSDLCLFMTTILPDPIKYLSLSLLCASGSFPFPLLIVCSLKKAIFAMFLGIKCYMNHMHKPLCKILQNIDRKLESLVHEHYSAVVIYVPEYEKLILRKRPVK